MDYVRLGLTGLKVSRICLGMMSYGSKDERAWLLHKPVVTAPIIGATKPAHIEDALAAAQLALSDEEISRLEEKYLPHGILGHS